MRLRVRQKIHYRFDRPARMITHVLRLTPRSHDGQHVIRWNIDVESDCALKAGEDGFGNVTHVFTVRGPCDELTMSIVGEVDSFDMQGLVRGSAERLPVELYLRATSSTTPDAALRRFADGVASDLGTLDKLKALMAGIRKAVVLDFEVVEGGDVAVAFASGRGNGVDLAQIFVTCARLIGCPARVTTGYYLCEDRQRALRHGWAEVFVAGTGWIGFDPAHDIRIGERHVRVATGLDGYSAAPVRGTRTDNASVTLELIALPAPAWAGQHNQR